MKPAVLAYVPPPSHGHPEAFLANMRAYDPGVELILYSDHAPYGFIPCQSPEVVKHPRAMFRISNHAFLSGLKIAVEREISNMLYLEEDSRVRGDGWASRLFDEFSTYPLAVAGGTPCMYDMSSHSLELLKRATTFACEYFRGMGIPMIWHGFQRSPRLYPNGSVSILDVSVMREIFAQYGFEHDLASAARTVNAWDEIIGNGLFQKYGLSVFDVFAPSMVSYSGCGNDLFNEPQRIEMLTSDRVCALHQVKSNWAGV